MTEDEARRNFVKMVYAPYKVDTYTRSELPEDEKPESLFYALIPAGVYSIVGEDAFIDIVNAGFSRTYDKNGDILSEEEPFLGLYVGHTNEQGIPYLEYEDPEVDRIFYKLIPISWDEAEFPKNVLDNLQDNSPIVENAVQIVKVYLDDIIREHCAGNSLLEIKSKYDFIKNIVYAFCIEIIKWAQSLASAP